MTQETFYILFHGIEQHNKKFIISPSRKENSIEATLISHDMKEEIQNLTSFDEIFKHCSPVIEGDLLIYYKNGTVEECFDEQFHYRATQNESLKIDLNDEHSVILPPEILKLPFLELSHSLLNPNLSLPKHHGLYSPEIIYPSNGRKIYSHDSPFFLKKELSQTRFYLGHRLGAYHEPPFSPPHDTSFALIHRYEPDNTLHFHTNTQTDLMLQDAIKAYRDTGEVTEHETLLYAETLKKILPMLSKEIAHWTPILKQVAIEWNSKKRLDQHLLEKCQNIPNAKIIAS